MKTVYMITILSFLLASSLYSQNIRKDYREMTGDEKEAYVDALWEMWDNGDIANFENIHVNNFTPIHRNYMFLPWHRVFVKEYEENLQAINPDLFIPYWDWTDDQSTSPEWNNNDFLGQFNPSIQSGGWGLNRNLGDASLPNNEDVEDVLDLTSFSTGGNTGNGFGGIEGDASDFPRRWGDLEFIHNFAHQFVGANSIMNSASSPRDPVFFFHHSFVDKIWQDWTGTSSFSGNSLPAPYDSINPHNIVDSRDLNVWYAEDGLVILDQYETSGTNDYRYTGKIQAEDNFVVKNGSSVAFTAGNEIVLGPGFQVEAGGEFYAEVDPDVGNIAAKRRGDIADESFEDEDKPVAYSLSQNYPNPFNPATVISFELPAASDVTLEVFDILGRRVAVLLDGTVSAGRHEVQFDASNLSSGMYIYRIRANNFVQTRQMTLIK